MLSFNTTTGALTETSSAGTDTYAPPFTSSGQLDSYVTALKNYSVLKDVTIIDLSTAAADLSSYHVNAQLVDTSPKLPSVQIWKLPNNSLVVVYVDPSGNSSFSYKNDPNNYVQLMPNGSQIVPKGSTQNVSGPAAEIQGQATSTSGTPTGVLVLFALFIFFIFCIAAYFLRQ